MNSRTCWGIFRERAHSPGREFDDAEVLRLTGKHLEARGFEVSLRTPEEIVRTAEQGPPFLFQMCERVEILDRLEQWERNGTCQVNEPKAILNTYRHHMVPLLQREGISFPTSTVVSTASSVSDRSGPFWVKRADVHNTQDGDVVLASSGAEADFVLSRMAERSIPQAVIQEDVPGDLIKFYGVGVPERMGKHQPWFRWFYHKGQQLAGYRFDSKALTRLVQRAAASLGLEIYGGDVIATPEGKLVLIDLNAWPSFALCREEAAECIAKYLETRFGGGVR